jgi:hypothetical protein
MSKFLKIPNGDYKISVQPGGTITLDTGVDIGQVVITGDLLVAGETTTINTRTLEIEDNMIDINQGETGAGITLNFAGIQIERGTLPKVQMVFDENILPGVVPSDGGPALAGAFVLRDMNADGSAGRLRGLATDVIFTNNNDLTIVTGPSPIRVQSASDYENLLILGDDKDMIPNKAYVDWKVDRLGDSVTVSGFADFDTEIQIRDSERVGVNDSNISFVVDGVQVGRINNSRLNLHNLVIEENEIRSQGTSTSLKLTHPDDTSTVLINNTLGILPINTALIVPPDPGEGIKIYNSTEGQGGTGIYFINEDNTNDELVSRSKAILYGIIF